MTITSDQRAPARLGSDYADVNAVLSDRIVELAEIVFENNAPDLIEQATQAVIKRLASDPVAAIRDSGDIYTVDEIAHEMGVTVETVRAWTRLPVDDPRHLVRITACAHIRVLAWDWAKWVERNRS